MAPGGVGTEGNLLLLLGPSGQREQEKRGLHLPGKAELNCSLQSVNIKREQIFCWLWVCSLITLSWQRDPAGRTGDTGGVLAKGDITEGLISTRTRLGQAEPKDSKGKAPSPDLGILIMPARQQNHDATPRGRGRVFAKELRHKGSAVSASCEKAELIPWNDRNRGIPDSHNDLRWEGP